MNLIKELRAKRSDAIKRAQELAALEAGDNARALTDEESAEYAAKVEEARALKGRIAELEELEAEEAEARKNAAELNVAAVVENKPEERKVGGGHVKDAPIYSPEKQNFFRDIVASYKSGDPSAQERLRRNTAQVREQRASDGITTTNGDGGELQLAA